MGLRRTLRFWGRVVRYNLSSVSLVRAPDDYGFALRMLSQLVLVAALFVGGYLIGHFSAPNCGPAPDANCIEAQAPTPVAPTSVASAPQATAPQATAPLAPTPPVPAPPVAPSVSAPEVIKPSLPSAPTGGARPLSNDEVRETQAWLKAFGFDPGPLDGLPGSRTMAAVKRYQATRQAEETGLLSRSLLRQVRKDAGQS
jgi:Putative peptidoglycan binding domain